MILLLFVFVALLLPQQSFADLADCEYATVVAALAGASPDDTITCPADTVTWSSGVTVPDEVE